MSIFLGQLPPAELARLKAELAETLIAYFCYPRFFDYRTNSLRSRPVDRSKRQEVWLYLSSFDFTAWNRTDLMSPDFQYQVERLFIQFVQRNRNFFGEQGRKRMSDIRMLIGSCAASVVQGLRGHLTGQRQGNPPFGSPRPVSSWAATTVNGYVEPSWEQIAAATMLLQEQLQEARGEITIPAIAAASHGKTRSSSRSRQSARVGAAGTTSDTKREGIAPAPVPAASASGSAIATPANGHSASAAPLPDQKSPVPVKPAPTPVPSWSAAPTAPIPVPSVDAVAKPVENIVPMPPAAPATPAVHAVPTVPPTPTVPVAPPATPVNPPEATIPPSPIPERLQAPVPSPAVPQRVSPVQAVAASQPANSSALVNEEDVAIFEQMRYQLILWLRIEAIRNGIEIANQGPAQLLEQLRQHDTLDQTHLQIVSTLLNLTNQVIQNGRATPFDYKQALVFHLMHTRH